MDKRSTLIFIFIAIIPVILIISFYFKKQDSITYSNIHGEIIIDANYEYKEYSPSSTDLIISRSDYANKLYGFWLGQCIANWTGLVTEMDKIGDIGEIKTGKFYTRDDWGKPDHPNIWSGVEPSELSPTIDFVSEDVNGIWGADDDTDIEYMYQYLMYKNQTSILTGEQIREGWLNHIKKDEELTHTYKSLEWRTAFIELNKQLK